MGRVQEDMLSIEDLPSLPNGMATVVKLTLDDASMVWARITDSGMVRTFSGSYIRRSAVENIEVVDDR